MKRVWLQELRPVIQRRKQTGENHCIHIYLYNILVQVHEWGVGGGGGEYM